jgi:hypothetical protein
VPQLLYFVLYGKRGETILAAKHEKIGKATEKHKPDVKQFWRKARKW